MKTFYALFVASIALFLLQLFGGVLPTKSLAELEPKAIAAAAAPATVTLQEDFNSGALSGWNRYNGAFGSSSNACFNSNNIKVENGRLKLLINRAANQCGRPYSSAGVSLPGWNTGQIYGRWDVVAKMPNAPGATGYIGLYAINAWPPEVVMEHVPTDRYSLHLAQHYVSNGNKYEAKVLGGTDWGNEFHTYSLEWLPGKFNYYIDGVLKHTMTQKFADRPMYLSIATGTYNCGAWGGCPEQLSPNISTAMEIESVTVSAAGAGPPPPVNQAPGGYLDEVTNTGTANGWAADPSDFSKPIYVHFYAKQGTAAGFYIGSVLANGPRADLNAVGIPGDHAFSWKIPSNYAGYYIYAYGLDLTPNSPNPLLNQSPRLYNAPATPNYAPGGYLDAVNSAGQASGWAADPNEFNSPVYVHFYAKNGSNAAVYIGSTLANGPRADLNAAGYPGDHAFSWTVPAAYKGHSIYAYALDLTPNSPNPALKESPRTFP